MSTNTKLIAINYDDVVGAVTELQAEKKGVTILGVRERLGRGSFTTVKKFISQWRESQSVPGVGVEAGTSRVPPQLDSLWAEARKAAQAELEGERAAIEQFSGELEQKFQDLEQRAAEAERQRQLVETRLADLQVALAGSQVQIQDLVVQRDAANSRAAEALAQAAQERLALAEMFGQRLDQLVDVASAQVQALSRDVGAIQSQAAELEVSLQRRSDVLLEAVQEVSAGQAEAWPQIEHQLDEVTRQVRRSGGALHQIIRAPHHAGRRGDSFAPSGASRAVAARLGALERIRRLRRPIPTGLQLGREEPGER